MGITDELVASVIWVESHHMTPERLVEFLLKQLGASREQALRVAKQQVEDLKDFIEKPGKDPRITKEAKAKYYEEHLRDLEAVLDQLQKTSS